MQVMKRIEEQVQLLKKMQEAGARQPGIESLVKTLQLAQARIEILEKAVDERLPSEAEIALQLLPSVITRYPDAGTEEVSQMAFDYAGNFISVKDQRK